ncbi:EAL domain-containing protein [Phenylobacterium sp.]|uniref:sensor domain-containing protein n=1 Tax=Phenylobacterium sp. TaxID=1871053 RepID=UPI003919A0B4
MTSKPRRSDSPDFRALVEGASDWLWESDADLRLVWAGPQARALLGRAAGNLVGQPMLDLLPPRAGTESRPGGGLRWESEVGAPRKTPGVLETVAAAHRSQGGHLAGYYGVTRDITDRAWARTELEARARREVEYRERILSGVTRSAAALVAAASVAAAMPEALRIIGEVLDADRVVIIENEVDLSGADLLYHWQSPTLGRGLPRALFEESMLSAAAFAGELEPLRPGQAVVASRATANGHMAAVLEMTGAETALLVPIHMEGRWWGVLVVDECKAPRAWTATEIDALKAFAEMAGASIMRERHQVERRRVEEELLAHSQRDTLTGLANRKLFHQAVVEAMSVAEQEARRFALHYLDLDHFKDVNDTLGHPVGDRLLQAVAERLRGVTRHADLIARFGGDEFAVLQPDIAGPEDASALATKVLNALKAPFAMEGREIHIGVSIGVVLHEPGEQETAEALLSHAELALYRAKSEGRQTFRFFTASMDAEARRRVTLAEEIRKGLAEGHFFLMYQPQVETEGGRITGVEALVRWRHPTRGLVPPAEFIPETEANGLIVQLGDWILRTACRDARAWYAAGIAPPAVSVNMSAVQFRRPAELQHEVAEIVREAGIPPGLLQLELTETTLMEASKAQNDVLERFHRDGLKISLDDFGTGYSSLDYLHRYPVDQIKIAQDFVVGIVDTPGDAAIVKAAISLARELGIRVVAEGVENAEQARLLTEWGCKEIQGYYYSRPVPAEEFETMLRAGVVRPAARAIV